MTKESKGLFGVSAKPAEPTKLPTFRQFLKSQSKKKLKEHYQVEIIWAPNKWGNYTLETEDFRLRIAKGSVLYAPLARFCAADENIETPLGIKVINVRTGEFSLSQLEDEGNWTYINGDSLKWARPGID